ncbi:Enoyl-CoA hydratase/carnithine racemase [Paraburkholderia unamae]|uniref:enoyl-CoA hydratase/isomerase family protein n=1 Tax=Paraburkholderia unamae TaxID=219649 RepID=UPI001CADF2F9|nr:enoyl-CoA hydratase/isomerase family protein [Paraburkholderia unamae]CAG9274832.1 Enoyl-CoA hydratase/carnithine racemase [Paraburkholderia unamae]
MDSAGTDACGLRVETRGRVRWLRIERPARLNALDRSLVHTLGLALREAQRDDRVSVLVLTGAGRAFCAGADLHGLSQTLQQAQAAQGEGGPRRAGRLVDQCAALMRRLERVSKPVLAAVNGFAVGGGLELLLCCDLIVAARSARIGDGHAKIGALPGSGASARLPRRLPPAHAKFLLFTGDMLPADDPLLAALIHRVVDDASLESVTAALADTLAANSPLMLARLKRLLASGADATLGDALRLERQARLRHASSFDCREGVDAFREKRAPDFQGR